MGYGYTSIFKQDSISSICKSLLPFSTKKPSLAAAENKLSKQHSDYLKWQQNAYHEILNLMGLHKHGLLPSSQLASFRCNLLETLIASKGSHFEQPRLLRDKLLFLQELLYAKCISEEEYHASKRPLLQRLAVQGAELEATDVIVGVAKDNCKEEEAEEEEWSTIDLRDDKNLMNSGSKNKSKNRTTAAMKHIKDKASNLGFGSFEKAGRNRGQKSIFDNAGLFGKENVQTDEEKSVLGDEKKRNAREIDSVVLTENLGSNLGKIEGVQGRDEGKKAEKSKERNPKSGWKQWGFDGLKKWKRTPLQDETTTLPLSEKSRYNGDNKEPCQVVKDKVLSDVPPSTFIIDKVLGDKIKQDLLQIQTAMSSNPNFKISDDQMDAICRELPVNKSDLMHLFSKSWCEQYGELVLDVVKKQMKEHVDENKYTRTATLERRQTSSMRWTTFDQDENCHPNLFAAQNNQLSAFCPDQNPFWNGDK
ncbi:uncharacterized protein LOC141606113 [Silene latifolia]|uniref:uncharacterized protein LOC141606113 n=1 Tax=Silene latifolia TaxID=37657 RepID=UPI003D770941